MTGTLGHARIRRFGQLAATEVSRLARLLEDVSVAADRTTWHAQAELAG